jgi:hypothetical protein
LTLQGQFLPVTNGIIRDIANSSADESKLTSGNRVAFKQFFYKVQWVACYLFNYFPVSLVFDLGFVVFSLDGYFWVKTDE